MIPFRKPPRLYHESPRRPFDETAGKSYNVA